MAKNKNKIVETVQTPVATLEIIKSAVEPVTPAPTETIIMPGDLITNWTGNAKKDNEKDALAIDVASKTELEALATARRESFRKLWANAPAQTIWAMPDQLTPSPYQPRVEGDAHTSQVKNLAASFVTQGYDIQTPCEALATDEPRTTTDAYGRLVLAEGQTLALTQGHTRRAAAIKTNKDNPGSLVDGLIAVHYKIVHPSIFDATLNRDTLDHQRKGYQLTVGEKNKAAYEAFRPPVGSNSPRMKQGDVGPYITGGTDTSQHHGQIAARLYTLKQAGQDALLEKAFNGKLPNADLNTLAAAARKDAKEVTGIDSLNGIAGPNFNAAYATIFGGTVTGTNGEAVIIAAPVKDTALSKDDKGNYVTEITKGRAWLAALIKPLNSGLAKDRPSNLADILKDIDAGIKGDVRPAEYDTTPTPTPATVAPVTA